MKYGTKWRGHVNARGKSSGFGMFYGCGNHTFLSYEGEMKNGKFHGYGRLVYRRGQSYEGFFHQGSFSGCGILKTEESDSGQVNWLLGSKMTDKMQPTVDEAVFKDEYEAC